MPIFGTVYSREGVAVRGGEGKGHGKRIAAAVVNPASGTPERSALPKVQSSQGCSVLAAADSPDPSDSLLRKDQRQMSQSKLN